MADLENFLGCVLFAAVDAWLAYQRQGGLRFDDITEDLTKTRGKNGRPALEAIQ